MSNVNHGRSPLLVTGDKQLKQMLQQLAQAAGVQLEVATAAEAAGSRWLEAPLVLVGVDQARRWPPAGLPARRNLVLVLAEQDTPPRPGSDPYEPANRLGATQIAQLPLARPWLEQRLADCASGTVVVVLGGCGGAGASILATGLAQCAARMRHRVLLVDADPLAGGMDVLLGWETRQGHRWPALAGTGDRAEATGALPGLPAHEGLMLLAHDRTRPVQVPGPAMAAVLEAGRVVCDLVVVDAARAGGQAVDAALATAATALLLVPTQLRAAVAAQVVAATAKSHCPDLRLVVRTTPPGRLNAAQLTGSLGLPLAGVLRTESHLAPGLEDGIAPAGTGRGSLAALCRRLVTNLCPPTNPPPRG